MVAARSVGTRLPVSWVLNLRFNPSIRTSILRVQEVPPGWIGWHRRRTGHDVVSDGLQKEMQTGIGGRVKGERDRRAAAATEEQGGTAYRRNTHPVPAGFGGKVGGGGWGEEDSLSQLIKIQS